MPATELTLPGGPARRQMSALKKGMLEGIPADCFAPCAPSPEERYPAGGLGTFSISNAGQRAGGGCGGPGARRARHARHGAALRYPKLEALYEKLSQMPGAVLAKA
jgi:hypothetical protein